MKKPLIIEPISFLRPSRRAKRPKSLTRYGWLIAVSVGLIFILLSASAWFVFTARQVVIRIDPHPDRISLRGGLVAPRFGAYYLLRPGEYRLRAVKECYHPLERQFQVIDEKSQEINLVMEKLPGRFSIQAHRSDQPSVPLDGARITIDGREVGTTPATELEVKSGTRQVEIRTRNYQDLRTAVGIEGCGKLQAFDFALAPRRSGVMARSVPQGPTVKEGTLALQTNPPVDLKPLEGLIHFTVEPADAELFVDGTSRGKVPQKLELIATKHELEIKKAGYQSYRAQITPQPGAPQELNISLPRLPLKESDSAGDAIQAKADDVIKAPIGYPLKRIRPQTYRMGSSRREQGRRSNETLRKVELRRSFYMGMREVTHKEFKEFLPSHRSSDFKGHRLDRDELPVVEVTWEQAAMFCNWLSAKESLPPAYIKKGEEMVAAEPLGTGYRLPTEAEWEYCARFKNNQASLKYPWGDDFPPPAQSGNYADISAERLLASYLENYNDGYPGTAPPATFTANDLSLHDLGGNVAEWCHDYYSIYSYSDHNIYLDPLGPGQGKHHVVRGSSWKHAGIGTLRLAYRDYSNKKREDLGFRICRYVE